MTEMLGDGTADGAIELMARTNIEIVPIEKYNEWLNDSWR